MPLHLRPFDMVYPSTAQEAVEMRDAYPSSCYLSGGTHLIPQWRASQRPPDLVINLKRIQHWVRPEEVDGLWIDPATTVADLRVCQPVGSQLAALHMVLTEFGSPLIEPLATITGNLAAARPEGTLAVSMIALGATIFYDSVTGSGVVAADDLFEKPGQTTLPHGALITGVQIPHPVSSAHSGHLAIRAGLATSTPVVAASAVIEFSADGRVLGGRLSVAHATPTPREVRTAREIMQLGLPVSEVVDVLGDAAVAAIEPDDDWWASARYRQRMTRVVTERLIRSVAAKADTSGGLT